MNRPGALIPAHDGVDGGLEITSADYIQRVTWIAMTWTKGQ